MNTRELRAARARLGYSQSQVAKALGISTSSYSSKERGITEMSCAERIKCGQILELSFQQLNDFLFDGKLPNG